jgi:energy-converting hydrogenase Eha subunit H
VKVDAFEHFERIVGFVYVGDFYHNLVTFFVTFFVTFVIITFVTFVTKSNQKSRAVLRNAKG